ncbi:MAG: low-specificity L-threonine aldolase [Deltaproteobacteria bacterium]|nr:MAG: low-specificity L-threonine aldolase [Deltaproteobacteria bacterium]
MVDLRSDTVTKPTPAMRKAMGEAEVGDDVLGEDPTVNLLQEKVALLTGKEAGLFMPSGTMANQVAIKTHVQPGDEIIIDRDAHIYYYECGATAVISGGQFQCLVGEQGVLSAEAIASAIRPSDIHQPPSRLICLENTHNRGGGSVYTVERLTAISELAVQNGMLIHLDGARLFNAALACSTTVKEMAVQADSVCVALSKALGAPAGSVLCGSSYFIEQARRFRKMLGGGMRQVGILAAAGLHALDHHVTRLAEDHQNAKKLARGLAGVSGIEIDPGEVLTNIVLFDVAGTGMDADVLVERLATEGVLLIPFGPTTVRAVTHLDVSAADIDEALEIIRRVLEGF